MTDTPPNKQNHTPEQAKQGQKKSKKRQRVIVTPPFEIQHKAVLAFLNALSDEVTNYRIPAGTILKSGKQLIKTTHTFLAHKNSGKWQSFQNEHFNYTYRKRQSQRHTEFGILGAGEFGKLKNTTRMDGRKFCVKSIQKKDKLSFEKRLKLATTEFKNLQIIDPEATLFVSDEHIQILMTKRPGKEASQYFNDQLSMEENELTENDFMIYITQIAEQIKQFHDKKSVFCDLQPQNTLYDPITQTAWLIDCGAVTPIDWQPELFSRDYSHPNQKIGCVNAATYFDLHAIGMMMKKVNITFEHEGVSYPSCLLNTQNPPDIQTVLDVFKARNLKLQSANQQRASIISKQTNSTTFEEKSDVVITDEIKLKTKLDLKSADLKVKASKKPNDTNKKAEKTASHLLSAAKALCTVIRNAFYRVASLMRKNRSVDHPSLQGVTPAEPLQGEPGGNPKKHSQN